jgi:acetyl esterase/lipase
MKRSTRLLLVAVVLVGALMLAPRWTLMNAALALVSRIVSEGGVRVERGLAFGPDATHRLDVYHAGDVSPDAPVVLFIYGGGWRGGARDMYGFAGAALASRGLTTVIADYRKFPEARFPVFVEDAALAYRYVASELPATRGRPIVVMGHSAGAYIAAMLALNPDYVGEAGAGLPRPAALIGLAGPYAFDPTTWPSTREIFATAASADAARPIAFAGSGAPPALLIHGLGDETVRLFNSRDLAARLRASGGVVETLEIEGVGHHDLVLAMARGLRWRAPVLEKVTAFVGRHVRPLPVR